MTDKPGIIFCRSCGFEVDPQGHRIQEAYMESPAGRSSHDCLDCLEDARAGFLLQVPLLRPRGTEFPDGKGFLVWGDKWGYKFNTLGQWVKCAPGEQGQHGGLDIVMPVGTPLMAPAAGRVIHAGWQDPAEQKKGWGLHLKIEVYTHTPSHKGENILPWLTMAHLSRLDVKEGDYVNRGQMIGLSGETGHAFGPHLHCQLEEPGDWPRRPMRIKWLLV